MLIFAQTPFAKVGTVGVSKLLGPHGWAMGRPRQPHHPTLFRVLPAGGVPDMTHENGAV